MKEALAKRDADDKLKAAQKDAEDKLKAAKVQLNAAKKDADDKLKAAMVQLDAISKSRAATVAARTRVAAQLATDPPPCPKRQRTAAAAASNTFTMAGRKRRAVRQITKDDMDDDDGEALTPGTWERADAVRPRALSHHTVTSRSSRQRSLTHSRSCAVCPRRPQDPQLQAARTCRRAGSDAAAGQSFCRRVQLGAWRHALPRRPSKLS